MKHVWVLNDLATGTMYCSFCKELRNEKNAEDTCLHRSSRWKDARSFLYKKREYMVLFSNHREPIKCWPNAGHYVPLTPPVKGLGIPLLVWDESEEEEL